MYAFSGVFLQLMNAIAWPEPTVYAKMVPQRLDPPGSVLMRINKPTVILAGAILLGTAFATVPQPAKSQSKSSYCSGYAQNYARKYSRGPVVGGAITGAIGGAIIGGIIGGRGGAGVGAAIGAGGGAITGGAVRSQDYNTLYRQAYNRCMRN